MKKIFIAVFSLIIGITVVKASDKSFYLGDRIPDVYYIMDKTNKKVFAQFKRITKTDTNELVYCIEPGVVLSSEDYIPYEGFDERFNLSKEKWDKVNLIAMYGYKYKNHDDIKWYIVTQYMIWQEVMPDSWNLYFVDKNKNRINNMYVEEINEVNNLIKNHKSHPEISEYYEFDINEPISIFDDAKIIGNYKNNYSDVSISNNKINILPIDKRGNYKYTFSLDDTYNKAIYFYHPDGQNVLLRGYDYVNSFSVNIKIKSGKIKINECDKETFIDEIIGGIYEVLDQDDTVIETIDCSEDYNCLSKELETGHHKIRVKKLNDEFIKNENIYDVLVEDGKTSEVNVCSLHKNIVIPIEDETNDVEEVVELPDEKIEIINEEKSVEVDKNEETEIEEITIPNTKKESSIIIIFSTLIIIFLIGKYIYEKRN